MASTTIRASRASIIHLEIRSRPFCRPKEQTRKPTRTMMAMKMVISVGLASMELNTPSTVSLGISTKVPVVNL